MYEYVKPRYASCVWGDAALQEPTRLIRRSHPLRSGASPLQVVRVTG